MTPWPTLAPAALVCLAGALLSYTRLRDGGWYPHAMVVLGACSTGLYALGVRAAGSAERVYAYTVSYDAVVLLAYYALPLALLGLRPRPAVFAGAALVAAGVFLVHAGKEW